MSVIVCCESPRTADASRLLAEAEAELVRRYGRSGPCPLEEVEVPEAAFLVARVGPERKAVGCVILRPFADEPPTAEIKRLFVDADARGQGAGAALMLALETQARVFGYTYLVLETGIRQPEAIRLYERCCFISIPCWGEYIGNPFSLCYGKVLLSKK